MCRNQTGRINDITDKTELWWTKMMYRISGKLEAASALNLLKTHNTLRRRFCNQRIVLSLSLLSGALNKWDLLYVMTDEIHCMFSVVVTENISVLRISKFSWKYLGHQSHVSVRDPSQHPSPRSSMTCSVQHNAKSQHRSCIPHTINWISNRKTDKSANTHHFTRHLWLSEWTDGYISPRKNKKIRQKTKKTISSWISKRLATLGQKIKCVCITARKSTEYSLSLVELELKYTIPVVELQGDWEGPGPHSSLTAPLGL